MIILPSAYLPPVQYFAKLYTGEPVMVEIHDSFVKQTYRNRCMIDSPNGILSLSIPVEHGGGEKLRTCDVMVSEHGRWRQMHWNALLSSYRNSPFFDYYADDFRPFFSESCPYRRLVDFNRALLDTVCSLLDLHPDISYSESYIMASPEDADLREAIRPKQPAEDLGFCPVSYYQVFASKHGFQPNLSIFDLLCCMGPETRLVLRDSVRK